jgi:hypothetical protein
MPVARNPYTALGMNEVINGKSDVLCEKKVLNVPTNSV